MQTIEVSEKLHLVVEKEASALARESGWWISRTYNPQTLMWIDHACPGYGVTYWVTKEAAKRLGLEEAA